jgi:histone RNA hairpin-binding protein
MKQLYQHMQPQQLQPMKPPGRPAPGDPHRQAQRQKQIDFGKNTRGYQKYLQTLPR